MASVLDKDTFGETHSEINPKTGGAIARGYISKNPYRLHPTTGGVAPAPVVAVKEKTYIPTYLHQADRKWLKSFLEE